MDSSDLGIIIASFGAMLAGFFAIMRYILKQSANDRTDDRKERQDLANAIKRMADSTDKVAQATVKGSNEAKERNGHLGEQNIQLAAMLTAQTDQLSEIAHTLTSSAVLLVKDTKTAFDNTQTVAELLKTSVEILAKDTKTAHQGTENVRKDLVKNKTKGTFTFQGDLK